MMNVSHKANNMFNKVKTIIPDVWMVIFLDDNYRKSLGYELFVTVSLSSSSVK